MYQDELETTTRKRPFAMCHTKRAAGLAIQIATAGLGQYNKIDGSNIATPRCVKMSYLFNSK